MLSKEVPSSIFKVFSMTWLGVSVCLSSVCLCVCLCVCLSVPVSVCLCQYHKISYPECPSTKRFKRSRSSHVVNSSETPPCIENNPIRLYIKKFNTLWMPAEPVSKSNQNTVPFPGVKTSILYYIFVTCVPVLPSNATLILKYTGRFWKIEINVDIKTPEGSVCMLMCVYDSFI